MASTPHPLAPPFLRTRTGWVPALILGVLAAFVVFAGFGPAVPSAAAAPAPTPMVDLGTASTYAVLSGASVGNTVSADGAPHTTLHGDLGVKANAQPTGFPPGVVTGTKSVGNAAAATAHADLVAAYTQVAGRTGGTPLAGALAGMTVGPGLHTIGGAASNTTTLTLDAAGNPNAVFVFQVNGALAFAAASHVVLTNGAQASHVFWQVNGAGAIGAASSFAGTLMALDAVAVGNGSVVNGRLFARNGALTLDDNEVYSAPPKVFIDGGTNAYTTDTTPTIAGTTDIQAPALVTVTVNGQTLTATPADDGSWSVTSAILANATYPVVASVTDGAGNTGESTQQLTVDTVPPAVAIEGGPAATTNDPTPTIFGTSDVAPGSIVHIGVGTQTLTALVQSGGTWNVTPAALADGSSTVTASVSDPAGNVGTASQTLTVDSSAPSVSIAGGATALTDDATPAISGTASVPAGTIVTVTLADETLSGVVDGDGVWSVTAAALADGPHRIVMTVSDPSGNPASATQTLTVDTVAPNVAISGGASAATSDASPTITGTSDAAPGTTVTVSIAAQSMTTLLQANGTWNATPAYVGNGTWAVAASAPDPAGNVGSADQTLFIGPETPAPVPPAPTPDPPVAGTTVPGDGTQHVAGPTFTIGTKLTAPAGSHVTATASGTVKISGVRRTIKLATTVMSLDAGQSGVLGLKPGGNKRTVKAAFKAIEAAIAKGKTVTARLTIQMVDDSGNTRVVKRNVQLTK